jgi:hypothetical protein
MNKSFASRRLRVAAFVVLCAATVLLASCATQPLSEVAPSPPGFLFGLLHGFLILFSFLASLFTDYRIYAYPNSGGWYDFGYLLGAMMFLGGGGASAR